MAAPMGNRYQRSFYVVFKEMQEFRWWNIFTGKKYAHVILLTDLDGGGSMMIDPAIGGAFMIEFKEPAYTVAYAYGSEGAEVEHFIAKGDVMLYPDTKFIRTCVSVAKDFLGIKGFFIITPKQLLKRIRDGRKT